MKIRKAQAELMLQFLTKASPARYCSDLMIKLNAQKRDQLREEVNDVTEECARGPLPVQEKEMVPVEPNKQITFQIWEHGQQICSVKQGETLRIQATAPFELHWSANESVPSKVVPSAYAQVLAFYFVDISISTAQVGPLRFTFFWTNENLWEGQDYSIAIA